MMAGRQKERVLPEPVNAIPIMSRPVNLRLSSMALIDIGQSRDVVDGFNRWLWLTLLATLASG